MSVFMKIIDMDKYFEDKILRRGYEYYKKNYVKKVRELGGIYSAIVTGTYNYHVVIDANQEKYDVTCDCPYDYYCKHMAAVLYYLKKDGIVSKDKKNEEYTLEFGNTKELQKCLNKELRNMKSLSYDTDLSYDDLLEILKKVFEKVDKEDISSLYDYAITIHMWVDNHINEFYTRYNKTYEGEYSGYNDIPFDSDENIYNSANNFTNITDKSVYEFILNYIFECIKNNLIYLKHYLYFLYNKYQEDEYIEYYCDYLEIECLVEKAFSKEMAQYLIEFINSIEKSVDYYEEKFENWVLMLKLKFYDKDKIIMSTRKNLFNSNNRDFVLNYYKENDYVEYVKLLEEIILLNIEEYVKQDYIEKLIEIYKKENNKDDYERIVKLNYTLFPNIDNYLLIKNMYEPKEWLKLRNSYILPYKQHIRLYIDLCFEENMDEEVFETLNNLDVDYLNCYVDKLKLIDMNRASLLYKNKVVESAEHCYNGRKSYEIIVQNLLKLYNLERNMQDVEEVIKLFRDKYKNRRAMMEELDYFEDTYLN